MQDYISVNSWLWGELVSCCGLSSGLRWLDEGVEGRWLGTRVLEVRLLARMLMLVDGSRGNGRSAQGAQGACSS